MTVAAASNLPTWPIGEGEMARRIRDFDWSATTLGPAAQWCIPLRSAVGMMLDIAFPSYVWWGTDFIQLYNDAAIGTVRDRHPAMLGHPASKAWSDIWGTVGGFAASVLREGRAVLGEDLPLSLERNGEGEPSWFAFSYNPLRDESGRVAGIFITAVETTARVTAERQQEESAALLRDSEARYRSIFAATGEAIALCEAILDRAGQPLDFRILDANPAYERATGRTWAASIGDATSSHPAWPARDLLPAISRVLAGETVRVEQVLANSERWFETQLIPSGGGNDGRFIIVSSEVTARRRAELAVRRSQERQAFLLTLSDAIRLLTDAAQIEAAAVRLLGRQLHASRVAYGDIADDELVVAGDYADGVSSFVGRLSLDQFGVTALASLRHGNTVVLGDVGLAIGMAPMERQAYADMQTAAFIAAPLLREGQLVAVLSVQTAEPRIWTTDEIVLVEDVAERIWMALERVRAEGALQESEERLRIALEAGRMGTWRYDMRTGEQQWSRQQFEIFGLDPASGPPTRELFLSMVHPDDLALVEFTADDVRPQGTFLDTAFRIIRPNGDQRQLVAHALARFDEDGRPWEIIGINQDITEQRQAENALRESEALFRSFAEASSDVLWVRGTEDMQWQFLSPAFEAIYGLTRDEVETGDNLQSWANLILPEDRQAALDGIKKAAGGDSFSFEYRIKANEAAGIRWLRSTTFPMRNGAGRIERIGGIGHDLTELKQAEEHQRLLLAELQHRVRNTLSVIRAIARRTSQNSVSVEDYAGHLEGRIDAFARVQAAVTRNPIGGVDLETLIVEELRAYRWREGESLTFAGPPVRLKPKAAETIALAIHELATNALKYGALSAPAGRLDIVWRLETSELPVMVINWRESGVSLVPPQPTRRGFGTEVLLHMLAYELDAKVELDFQSSGLVCQIVLPIEGLVQDQT